jgi:hypothetical protein
MNDELKNKSGKVKVMYVRSDDDSDKRTQNPRTGKGAGADRLVPTVAVAPRAKRKTVVAVLLAMSEAMTVDVTAAE